MSAATSPVPRHTGTRPAAPPREARDPFYLQAALAIGATAYLGFWFTYFGPQVRGTYPDAAPAVHVHGWSFFAWYLLFPLQAGLIRSRRIPLHRVLGRASLALAAVMTATGLLVLGVQMAAAVAAPAAFWSTFGPMVGSTLLLFTGFYAAALAFRRNGAHHKRWLIVASAAGLGAAAFRLVSAAFGDVAWASPAGVLATNLFIVAGMVHDLRRDGRIHPAYRLGLPICVGVELAAWLLTPTVPGQALAHGLAWVGRTLAFLY